MYTNTMNDRHREVILKIRLNPAEHAAIVKMAVAQGSSVAALVRAYIHQHQPK